MKMKPFYFFLGAVFLALAAGFAFFAEGFLAAVCLGVDLVLAADLGYEDGYL